MASCLPERRRGQAKPHVPSAARRVANSSTLVVAVIPAPVSAIDFVGVYSPVVQVDCETIGVLARALAHKVTVVVPRVIDLTVLTGEEVCPRRDNTARSHGQPFSVQPIARVKAHVRLVSRRRELRVPGHIVEGHIDSVCSHVSVRLARNAQITVRPVDCEAVPDPVID